MTYRLLSSAFLLLHLMVGEAFDVSNNNLTDYDYDRSLFTVVQFANIECTRGLHKGSCYTNFECHTGVTGTRELFDTSSASKCQANFGVCCITRVACGGFSSNNNTYLQSPGFQSSFNYGLDCTQSIRIDDSICQLRMDIEDLTLAYPTSSGFCDDDYLKVNQDTKFEYLCGITKNNHFYLDVDASYSNNVEFNFHTSSTKSFDRSWSIRVQKIMCDTDAEAKRGCGQWYTGTSGSMSGFNMDGRQEEDYMIHGQNYAVCVRMELGYCSITYTEPGSNAWHPVCNDIWERPTRTSKFSGDTKCGDNSVTDSTYTFNFLSPHMFWLDSTRDAGNSHRAKTSANINNYGTYVISYIMNKC